MLLNQVVDFIYSLSAAGVLIAAPVVSIVVKK
jgi:hypothetical protein